MKQKLITLAVAAAIAAPVTASAEAILYGKLNVSIDYADVKNAYGLEFDTFSLNDNFTTENETVDPETGFITYTGDIDGDPEDPWILTVSNPDLLAIYGDELVDADIQVVRIGPDGRPIYLPDSKDFKGWGINGRSSRGYMPGESRANRVGVKGSEDLGNGLKAIYQVEFGVQLTDTGGNVVSGNDPVTMRNSFVGLAGGFGTILAGRHDTPLKISTGKLDLFADTMADYNGTVGFDDVRADNVVAYISPSFSGFSFMGAVHASGGGTAGEGANVNADSLAEAYSLAGIYSNGPFYASVAYEVFSNNLFMDSETSILGSGQCINDDGFETLGCSYIEDDFTKWRFGLGLLDWNGFTLTAIYEQQDGIPDGQTRTPFATIDFNGNISLGSIEDGVRSQDLWQVQAGYAFGNSMFKAMYGAVDRDDQKFLQTSRDVLSINNLRQDLQGDRYTWAVGLDHNFSKRTKAYVLYTQVDDDAQSNPFTPGEQWSGFSLGMVHKF
jgi:predicted porin